MRRTTWTLVVGSALVAAGARAEDAVPAPRADVVFAAGDRLHGSLRGGEAHVLQVRLAKGDVYSLRVAASDRDQTLLLHATVRDPRGREINADARVRHLADGKRVELGPFRAATTGTYEVEILGDGTYVNRGDYAAKSKLRLSRTSYALPTDGAPTKVEVPAGATLRLRTKGELTKMTMALPGEASSAFAGDDPLVAALRDGGLASSTTGTFWFAAQGARSASITLGRRGWKAIDVAAPTFEELPADKIPAGFAPPATPVIAPPSAPQPASKPIAVDAGAGGTASLFFAGANMSAAGPMAMHSMTSETNGIQFVVPDPKTPPTPPAAPPETPPATPPVVNPPLPPVPPVVVPETPVPTQLGKTGYGMVYAAWPASPSSTSLFGMSAFQNSVGWRNAPWGAWYGAKYPASIATALLPGRMSSREVGAAVHGDDADPFVTRSFDVQAWPRSVALGTVRTTTRYYVDGHQVAGVLATGGDMSITWIVEGAGELDGVPWTATGQWRSEMHAPPAAKAWGVSTTNRVDGNEVYVAGGVTETVEVLGYELKSLPTAPYLFDAVGTIRNTLSVPAMGVRQVLERTYREATWRVGIDRRVPVELKLTTASPETPPEGVIDEETFDIFLC